MNDQNNNNPQQPRQPQQPGQPQQPQQPVQPYQQQPGQPYQPQQPGQPYQPQGQPYQPQPYQAYGQPPIPPQKKKSKWWIWLIVAIVVVGLIVAALFFFGILGQKRAGNEGVWAAYDYFDSLEAKRESVIGSNFKELNDRLNTQEFEIDGEIDINSDLITELGMGVDHIGADFQIKYDLIDLGIKLDLFNITTVDLYLIEDELVAGVLGEAYLLPLELTTDADLDEPMSLEDRLTALNSMSSGQDFETLIEDVIVELAPAVSDDMTERETVDVYSPKEDDEVEMTAITTTLDQDDLFEIVTAFGENLEANDELLDDLQDLIDAVADAADEDIDVGDLIDDMIDLEEEDLEDMGDFDFSWSVYRYKNEYVGISLAIDVDEVEIEVYFMTEFDRDTIYTSVTAEYNGDEVLSLLGERVYTNDAMTFDMEAQITIPEDEYTEEMVFALSVSGDTTIEKDSSTEYVYYSEVSIDIEVGDILAFFGIEDAITLDIEMSADCLFDDDFDSLSDDDDWNEIYDQDWNDIEDLSGGLLDLPLDLPISDF